MNFLDQNRKYQLLEEEEEGLYALWLESYPRFHSYTFFFGCQVRAPLLDHVQPEISLPVLLSWTTQWHFYSTKFSCYHTFHVSGLFSRNAMPR